jgi:hypothetical protein
VFSVHASTARGREFQGTGITDPGYSRRGALD